MVKLIKKFRISIKPKKSTNETLNEKKKRKKVFMSSPFWYKHLIFKIGMRGVEKKGKTEEIEKKREAMIKRWIEKEENKKVPCAKALLFLYENTYYYENIRKIAKLAEKVKASPEAYFLLSKLETYNEDIVSNFTLKKPEQIKEELIEKIKSRKEMFERKGIITRGLNATLGLSFSVLILTTSLFFNPENRLVVNLIRGSFYSSLTALLSLISLDISKPFLNKHFNSKLDKIKNM